MRPRTDKNCELSVNFYSHRRNFILLHFQANLILFKEIKSLTKFLQVSRNKSPAQKNGSKHH